MPCCNSTLIRSTDESMQGLVDHADMVSFDHTMHNQPGGQPRNSAGALFCGRPALPLAVPVSGPLIAHHNARLRRRGEGGGLAQGRVAERAEEGRSNGMTLRPSGWQRQRQWGANAKGRGHGSAPAHRPVGAAGCLPNPYGGPNPAAPTPCRTFAPVWQSPRRPSLGSAARPRSRRTNRRTGSSSSRPPSRRRPASEPDQRAVTVSGGDGRWHRSRTQTVTPSVMLISAETCSLRCWYGWQRLVGRLAGYAIFQTGGGQGDDHVPSRGRSL